MQLNQLIVPLLLTPALVAADKAPKIKKNPKDIVAFADFPKGNVVFSARKGGEVEVHVDITGLPPTGGPFQYHIHDLPVGPDGSCDNVGDHFNPYKGNSNCEIQRSDGYCELGDLSGKHGWINTTCFETKYSDPFLSLNKKSKSYIVGKSVVLHLKNKQKFACANIELASPEKVQRLIQEVNDKDVTAALSEVVEDDYEFDEDAPDAEDNEDNDNFDFSKKIGKHRYNRTIGGDDDDWDNKKWNKSNRTLKPQGVSTDCENGSTASTFGLTALLAGLVGFLL